MDFLEENYVIMEALLLTWRLEPCQKVQHQTSVGSGKNCPEFPLTFVCSSTVCRLQLLSFQTLKVSNWSSECEWWQLVIWMNGCCVVRRFIPKSSWIWLYLNLNPQISCLLTIWYNRKYTQFILIWNCFRKTVHQEGQYMEPVSLYHHQHHDRDHTIIKMIIFINTSINHSSPVTFNKRHLVGISRSLQLSATIAFIDRSHSRLGVRTSRALVSLSAPSTVGPLWSTFEASINIVGAIGRRPSTQIQIKILLTEINGN